MKDAKNSYKQLADKLSGFGEILEKTNSHLEEMDPMDAKANHKSVFKKHLAEYMGKSEDNGDNSESDDTDSGVVISQSGSWTIENCNERLMKLEQERKERREQVALYLQAQESEDCKAPVTETDNSANKTNTAEQNTNLDITKNKEKDKHKSIDFKSWNQGEIFEEMTSDTEHDPHNMESCLGIPEISFEAPTPRAASPCPLDGQEYHVYTNHTAGNMTHHAAEAVKADVESTKASIPFDMEDNILDNIEEYSDKVEKISIDLNMGTSPKDEIGLVKITDDDWDRMETLAEEERANKEEEEEIVENNENRAKLQEFVKNPQIDISRSRLAQELKVIMEDAKRRMEEDYFPAAGNSKPLKRKKKRSKGVKFEEPSKPSFFENSSDKGNKNYPFIEEAVKQVETEKHGITDITDEHNGVDDIDDDSLLDGFMDGFQDEKEVEQVYEQPSILKYIEIMNEEKEKDENKVKKLKMNILVTSGILALLAIGGLVIWTRVSHH